MRLGWTLKGHSPLQMYRIMFRWDKQGAGTYTCTSTKGMCLHDTTYGLKHTNRMMAMRLCATKTNTNTKNTRRIHKGQMKIFVSDWAHEKLPQGHRFPMQKYKLVREELEGDAGLKDKIEILKSPLIQVPELQRVHDKGYIGRVFHGKLTDKENRAIGFPWTINSVQRYRASAGGTLAALHTVMADNTTMVAAHAAGGTHHSFRDHGEGFCVFNDIAIAAVTAEQQYAEQSLPILVIDLDVHQGNGTADIFEGHDSIFTFSIHGANNYPWRTRRKSTVDVEVDDNTEDEEYLSVLSESLKKLFADINPKLVIYQAGVDALKEDSFGRLALTRQGLIKRNNMVYDMCIANDCKLVICMGGGYSRPIDATVLAHSDVFRVAALRYSSISNAEYSAVL